MKFEIEESKKITKNLAFLNAGDVFYVPGDKIYCIKIQSLYPDARINVVNLENGACHSYETNKKVVPVTIRATIENPYLQD